MQTTIHVITYGMDDVSKLAPLATATGGYVHTLTDVYDLDQLFTARYAGLGWHYNVTAWHPGKYADDHAGAVITMEGAHRSDRSLLDVVGRFSNTSIELLNGVSDAGSIVLRVPQSDLHTDSTGDAYKALEHVAAVLRTASDLVVEFLQPAGTTDQPEAATPTFEQVRAVFQRWGVASQQVVRGATVEERFGSALKSDGVSLYLVLYRP